MFWTVQVLSGVVRDHRMGGGHIGLASRAHGALCVHPLDVIFLKIHHAHRKEVALYHKKLMP